MVELSPTLENAVGLLLKLDTEDLKSVIDTVCERVLQVDLNSRRNSALLLDASGSAVLEQKVQADETYVGLSFKGNGRSGGNPGRNPEKARE